MHISISDCSSDEFVCQSDHTCISKNKVCDSFIDCKDRSDERECESKYCFKDISMDAKILL